MSSARDQAEVVVIGGGIFGASVGLHLLRAGVKDCLIVERDRVAEATSAAGAGFVDTWAEGSILLYGPEELALEHYAMNFYGALSGNGHEIDHRRNGCLWICPKEADWPSMESLVTEGPSDVRILEPLEVERLTGIVSAEGVFRGVLRPSSGQVSSERATRAVVARFCAEGGRLREHTPVQRLIMDRGRVVAIETPGHRISCDVVVLAAGAWANELLRELGVFLPMVPLVGSRLITEPLDVPDTMPALFVAGVAEGWKLALWLRGERGRLLWGSNYEVEPRYRFVREALPERLAALSLNGVVELQRMADRVAGTVPLLGRYRSLTVAHGLPCYTVDGRSLVGEVPGFRGLYIVAGCNEAGITHGPGFGRVIAETITESTTQLTDRTPWSVDRFGDSFRTTEEVVEAMAPWWREHEVAPDQRRHIRSAQGLRAAAQ